MKRKPDPVIKCKVCGVRITRKRFPGGIVESPSNLSLRKYCGRQCMRLAFIQDAKRKTTPAPITDRKKRLALFAAQIRERLGTDRIHI